MKTHRSTPRRLTHIPRNLTPSPPAHQPATLDSTAKAAARAVLRRVHRRLCAVGTHELDAAGAACYMLGLVDSWRGGSGGVDDEAEVSWRTCDVCSLHWRAWCHPGGSTTLAGLPRDGGSGLIKSFLKARKLALKAPPFFSDPHTQRSVTHLIGQGGGDDDAAHALRTHVLSAALTSLWEQDAGTRDDGNNRDT